MHTSPSSAHTVDHESLSSLPTPVRRYLQTAVPDGTRLVDTARLTQHGQFRLGGPDAGWKELTATQTFTTDPPGFVWDGSITLFPFVTARAVDSYWDGEGSLKATLYSLVTVASADPSPEMNEGQLVRYLVESVWIPTALLPSDRLSWEPIDDHSARATLVDGDTTASAVFHFENELVTRVSAERYNLDEDTSLPWTGYLDAYTRCDGLLVPTQGEVEWHLPEGDLPYWRATIDSVSYEFAGV